MSCPDKNGSINNETALPNYVAPSLCIGEWEISGVDSDCADKENAIQQSYAAEILNINGAPIRVYRLLGIHEQGGSVLTQGSLFSSASQPGHDVAALPTSSWQSALTGSNVVGVASIGLDFGFTKDVNGLPMTSPPTPNWVKVGAIALTQANNASNYAKQVKVDITDGALQNTDPVFLGAGSGSMKVSLGPLATPGQVVLMATSPDTFMVTVSDNGTSRVLGVAHVDEPFVTTYVQLTVISGPLPYAPGDMFSLSVDYVWRRAGVFNVVMSTTPTVLDLKTQLIVRAIRVTPTMFTGTGYWEVTGFDVLASPPTNINNIQDLFFQENRDRDYDKTAVVVKCQYSPADSMGDLSKFGLSILDQYSFTASFASVVGLLGRPIVVGDIVEVTPELQYDQNLKPVRKFLEVTDTSWATEGYTPNWTPILCRFTAQQVLPSQETRDLFGSIDTQKYMTADSILGMGLDNQLDTIPLTGTEEIIKAAKAATPETGSDGAKIVQSAAPAVHPPGGYDGTDLLVEDGLPPNNEAYGEGYALPDPSVSHDGDWFRLNYPENMSLPSRLYRFSILKNRWIYMETDRRVPQSSHKSAIRKILASDTKVGLGKKV